MVELNWIVLRWSCWDIDEVPSAPSNCSPPSFFKVYKWYVPFSSFFNVVGQEDPTILGGKARHNELGLNVTLPLNVSLDLGSNEARDMT